MDANETETAIIMPLELVSNPEEAEQIHIDETAIIQTSEHAAVSEEIKQEEIHFPSEPD